MLCVVCSLCLFGLLLEDDSPVLTDRCLFCVVCVLLFVVCCDLFCCVGLSCVACCALFVDACVLLCVLC